jgi:uncharacterized protein YegJ (DUF2314 family)
MVSIALLLKRPEALDLARVRSAAAAAFRDAPAPPEVFPIRPTVTDPQMFGLVLGPLALGVIHSRKPYMRDADAAADRVGNFPARVAVQTHTAWMSVDRMRDCPLPDDVVYRMIGRLLAEFLGDNTAGMILLPGQAVVGYDFSFIPLFRNGRPLEAFRRGTPDRIIKVRPTEALAAAAREARARWPEFVQAFARRKPGQGFAIKKRFDADGRSEYMWMRVHSIDGDRIGGQLANEPRLLKSLKQHDPVTADLSNVEDWIYSVGRQNVGGFQAKVIQADADAGAAE